MTQPNIAIELLAFDGCPHADEALRLVQVIAATLVPGVQVVRKDVASDEEAKTIGFLGSPSIRINGRDAEGRSTTEGALACRIYEGGVGRPPSWMIEATILRALEPRGFLFLCVANSARSQMAEGIARSMASDDVRVQSAGSKPTSVRPDAIEVLAEIGIDISRHQSKDVSQIPPSDVDTVITLCGEKECPLFLGKATRVHWALPDPTSVHTDRKARLEAFRRTRDELRRRLVLVLG